MVPATVIQSQGFGASVAIQADRAVVGVPGAAAGVARLFEPQPGGGWSQVAELSVAGGAAGAGAGRAVAVSGDRVLVGAWNEDSAQASESGAAILFVRQANGSWTEVAKFAPAGATTNDGIGTAVGLDGDRLVVGAPSVDARSEAAYAFRVCEGCVTPFGTGTPGCDGVQTLGASTAPAVGTTAFALTGDHAPASSAGLGLVTDAVDVAGSDPFGVGIVLHVDLAAATTVLPLDFLGDANGSATASLPIPNAPALVGRRIHAQGIWVWTSCALPPFGLSSSRGLTMTLLAP